MKPEIMLEDLTARLYSKNIQDLRQIARVVGVTKPAYGRKDVVVAAIMALASGREQPQPRSSRGAPPKPREYDKQLVADIKASMQYYLAVRNGETLVEERDNLTVSDGVSADGSFTGILERGEKRWYVRVGGCPAHGADVSVQDSFITRFSLREGDRISGCAEKLSDGQGYGMTGMTAVNGGSPEASAEYTDFNTLVCDYPVKRLNISRGSDDITGRAVDFLTPFGSGQRAVVTGGSRSGKTQLLKAVCAGVRANHPDVSLTVLLLGARPEEVTEFKRTAGADNVIYTGFDDDIINHVRAAAVAVKYVKRQAELGKEAVLAADGLEKLVSSSGDDCDVTEINRLLAVAGNFNERGAVTLIGSLKSGCGCGAVCHKVAAATNMNIVLSEEAAAMRLFPALDLKRCYSAKPELILNADELSASAALRARCDGVAGLRSVLKEFTDTGANDELCLKYRD